MLHKACAKTMVASLAFVSIAALSAVKVEKPGELCAEATGVSVSLSEACAKELRVSTRDIHLIRSVPTDSGVLCDVTIDTPRGPKKLIFTDLWHNTERGNYFIGGRVCM